MNRISRVQIIMGKEGQIQFWRPGNPWCKSYPFNLRNFDLVMGYINRKPFEFHGQTIGRTYIYDRLK